MFKCTRPLVKLHSALTRNEYNRSSTSPLANQKPSHKCSLCVDKAKVPIRSYSYGPCDKPCPCGPKPNTLQTVLGLLTGLTGGYLIASALAPPPKKKKCKKSKPKDKKPKCKKKEE